MSFNDKPSKTLVLSVVETKIRVHVDLLIRYYSLQSNPGDFMKHDIDYFLKKLGSIPENLWNVGMPHDAQSDGTITHCALGHCTPEELQSLQRIFLDNKESVVTVNDTANYLGDSPKERILKALNNFKTSSN